MLPLVSLLFVISCGVAVAGWMRALKLNQKLINSKKRYATLDSERTFLVSQTTQLAEENAQLKARLMSIGAVDVKMLQKNRADTTS